MKLTPRFEPHLEKIRATERPFVKMLPRPVAAETTWWQSKIGGQPYLPLEFSYPKNAEGKDLFLLAQINFEEVPAFEPFPTAGILQFFIADDGLYGQDLDDPFHQDNFQLRFFPNIFREEEALNTALPFLRLYDSLPFDPYESWPLDFAIEKEWAPFTDFRFEREFGDDFFSQNFGEAEWEAMQEYQRAISAAGHKMGGYAHFTQYDPRNWDDPLMLLAQFDTDPAIRLCWGDMGVANFFIRKKDLIARDFSHVMYHWDCY